MTIFQDKTVAEYLLTSDKTLIDIILQNVKPKKVISFRYRGKEFKREPMINDLFEIKYKWILIMKEQLTSPTLSAVKNVLASVYDIRTDEQFYNCSVFDVFAAYAWIVEEVQNLYEIERQKLFKKPTQKQIAAGIEEFDQLDDVPVIDALAGGNVTEWEKILELPYGQILKKLLLNKIQRDYDERFYKQK